MPGGFIDPNLPAGFAPFNVQEIAGRSGRRLRAAGRRRRGRGRRARASATWTSSTPSGHLLRRLISQGQLNAPWGLALAPKHFGQFSGDLLVGNFGDGRDQRLRPADGQLPRHAA